MEVPDSMFNSFSLFDTKPTHDIAYNCICAPGERDTDQSVHRRNLVSLHCALNR